MAQPYRHFDEASRLLWVGIGMSAFRRLSAHETNASWFPDIRTIMITPRRLSPREQCATDGERAAAGGLLVSCFGCVRYYGRFRRKLSRPDIADPPLMTLAVRKRRFYTTKTQKRHLLER
jgi:hypothetical protein